jgi:hypothetical protein
MLIFLTLFFPNWEKYTADHNGVAGGFVWQSIALAFFHVGHEEVSRLKYFGQPKYVYEYTTIQIMPKHVYEYLHFIVRV